MADRGTALAYDATATPVGIYEHVMEPTAAFGAIVPAPYDASPVVLAAPESYAHPMEPTADFGATFTGLYYGPW